MKVKNSQFMVAMLALANNIKTANQKDLFINACFEVGLYTDTLVKSKLMVSDTTTAKASVKVRVVLDLGKAGERVVEPGEVVYGRRSQTLSATLEGAIAGCLSIVTNLDGSLSIGLDPLCVQPEVIQLILDTTPSLCKRRLRPAAPSRTARSKRKLWSAKGL